SAASTPIDMSIYAEHNRARVEVPIVPPASAAAQRLSFARRSLLDVPMAAAASQPAAGAAPGTAGANGGAALSMSASDGADDPDLMRKLDDGDFGLSTTFDVPAFLRRQDG